MAHTTKQTAAAPAGIQWKVTVYTGDQESAGTTSSIYISVQGPSGTTKEHELQNDMNGNFNQKTATPFDVVFEDVGDPSALTVTNGYTGERPGWYLKKIEMKQKVSGKLFTFPCEGRFDKAKGLTRELPLAG